MTRMTLAEERDAIARNSKRTFDELLPLCDSLAVGMYPHSHTFVAEVGGMTVHVCGVFAWTGPKTLEFFMHSGHVSHIDAVAAGHAACSDVIMRREAAFEQAKERAREAA